MILAIKQIPSEIVWRISELGAVGGFVGSILFFLVNLSDFKKLKMLHQAIRDATVHELNFFAVRIFIGICSGFVLVSIMSFSDFLNVPKLIAFGVLGGFSGNIIQILTKVVDTRCQNFMSN